MLKKRILQSFFYTSKEKIDLCTGNGLKRLFNEHLSRRRVNYVPSMAKVGSAKANEFIFFFGSRFHFFFEGKKRKESLENKGEENYRRKIEKNLMKISIFTILK